MYGESNSFDFVPVKLLLGHDLRFIPSARARCYLILFAFAAANTTSSASILAMRSMSATVMEPPLESLHVLSGFRALFSRLL